MGRRAASLKNRQTNAFSLRWLKTNPFPTSATQPQTTVATVNIRCGSGEQVVRWLGFVACSQLSYLLGEIPGRYVPQAVLAHDGRVLDVDYVRLCPPPFPPVDQLLCPASPAARRPPAPVCGAQRAQARLPTPPRRAPTRPIR